MLPPLGAIFLLEQLAGNRGTTGAVAENYGFERLVSASSRGFGAAKRMCPSHDWPPSLQEIAWARGESLEHLQETVRRGRLGPDWSPTKTADRRIECFRSRGAEI